ncbi:MAG TPA: hypothetical protein VK658_26610 [Chryseolinea sp.]|nr:hypothetical protein [Chryseolinea sp.]
MDREHELRFIREELGYLGIKEFPEKGVADLVNSGADKIQVTGTAVYPQYGTSETLAYTMYLKKFDQQANGYHAYAYQASLKSDPVKSRVFEVRPDPCFMLPDAFNLLNGRAVQKLVLDWPSRKMENSWFQLDFHKRDATGNFAVERYPDFKMNESLGRYPVKALMNPDERVNLFLSLLKGNAEPVILIRNGMETQAFAQADPRNTAVHLYAKWNDKLLKVGNPHNHKMKQPADLIINEPKQPRQKGMGM